MNAFEELEAKSFYVSYSDREPMEVVLSKDLQELMAADDDLFESAITAIKFSAATQEINLKCFFHTIKEGDIMTTEAAIAVASKGSPESDFCVQMNKYVNNVINFCLSLEDAEEVDSSDDD